MSIQTKLIGNETPSTWWAFFPLKGFTLTNATHNLSKPLFGDITVVNKRHIDSIIKTAYKHQPNVSKTSDINDMVHLIKNCTLRENFDTFVAVRRTGNIDSDIDRTTLIDTSRKRATLFSALLSIALYIDSKKTRTCCLVESIQRSIQSIAAIDVTNGRFYIQISGQDSQAIYDERQNFCMKRIDFTTLFKRTNLKSILNSLITNHTNPGKSHKDTLKKSLLLISDAITAPSPSSALLSIITAIEVMTSDDITSFDTIKKRLQTLIGNIAFESFDAEKAFQCRHKFVHKGMQLEERTLSNKSLLLGISALINYSLITKHFRNKSDLVAYLDYLDISVNSAQKFKKIAAKSTTLRETTLTSIINTGK